MIILYSGIVRYKYNYLLTDCPQAISNIFFLTAWLSLTPPSLSTVFLLSQITDLFSAVIPVFGDVASKPSQ